MRSKGRRAERRANNRKGGTERAPQPKTTTRMHIPPHIAALAEQLKAQKATSR